KQACGPNSSKPPATLPPDAVAEATPLPPLTPTRPRNTSGAPPSPAVFPASGNDEQMPAMPTIPVKVAEPTPPKVKHNDAPAPPAKKEPAATEPTDPFDPEQFNQQNKPPVK